MLVGLNLSTLYTLLYRCSSAVCISLLSRKLSLFATNCLITINKLLHHHLDTTRFISGRPESKFRLLIKSVYIYIIQYEYKITFVLAKYASPKQYFFNIYHHYIGTCHSVVQVFVFHVRVFL